MFLKLFAMTALFMSSFFLTSCNQDKKETPKTNEIVRFLWSPQAQESAQIKVINQFGEPIAQAQILIGSAQGNPFRGNFIQTDKFGFAQIPKEWTTTEHVTVDAVGYIRLTLLNQKPGDMTLKMSTAYLAQRAEVRGEVTQLPVVNGDKFIDFGLVIPAMTRADLLNFDLSQVISPINDTITVAGNQAQVPSNVSLPTQKENYIFNLTISKPVYRLMVPTLGQKRFFATRGKFPFKTVIDELRAGKPFYELINYFSITGGGLRETTVTGASTTLNIPGNEIDFKNTIQVETAATLPDEVNITLAVSETAQTLIPTDIKKSTGGTSVTMASLANAPAFVVSVNKRQTEFMASTPGADRMSASLMPYRAGEKQKLLPLVANPAITTANGYALTLPPAPAANGIHPIGVSATISDLFEGPPAAGTTTPTITANHRWEVVGLGWDSQIQLPLWPLNSTATKKRVEINYIGSSTTSQVNLDDSFIEAATHVTHASTDF